MWNIIWLVFYHQACQNILLGCNCHGRRGRNISEGVAEPSVATLWSLYREVSDICSWQTCYYGRLTGNGPPDNRYLCCEIRQHLLLDETQVTGKGSLHAKRLLQTNLPFLYIHIIWQSSVELIFFYNFFVVVFTRGQELVNFKNVHYGQN